MSQTLSPGVFEAKQKIDLRSKRITVFRHLAVCVALFFARRRAHRGIMLKDASSFAVVSTPSHDVTMLSEIEDGEGCDPPSTLSESNRATSVSSSITDVDDSDQSRPKNKEAALSWIFQDLVESGGTTVSGAQCLEISMTDSPQLESLPTPSVQSEMGYAADSRLGSMADLISAVSSVWTTSGTNDEDRSTGSSDFHFASEW